MGPNKLNMLCAWIMVGSGSVGAWLAYQHATSHRGGMVIVGFLVLMFLGLNLCVLLFPGFILANRRAHGEQVDDARFMPVGSTAGALLLYYFFRNSLGAQPMWRAVVISGVVIGLLALTRTLTAKPR